MTWLLLQREGDSALAVNLEKVAAITAKQRLITLHLDNGGMVLIEPNQEARERLLHLIQNHTAVSLSGEIRAEILNGG